MKSLIATAKAFSDPNRVRILAALKDGELCVCELVDGLKLSQSTLSTHLQVIRGAGLVNARKSGKWSYYALAPEGRRLWEFFLEFFGRQIPEDAVLKADHRRLNRRLSLREQGVCCVGSNCGGTSC